jgi:hypothetical protein
MSHKAVPGGIFPPPGLTSPESVLYYTQWEAAEFVRGVGVATGQGPSFPPVVTLPAQGPMLPRGGDVPGRTPAPPGRAVDGPARLRFLDPSGGWALVAGCPAPRHISCTGRIGPWAEFRPGIRSRPPSRPASRPLCKLWITFDRAILHPENRLFDLAGRPNRPWR